MTPDPKPTEALKPKREKCIHCRKQVRTKREGRVCEKCYSKYTPGMLADLEA